MSDEKLKKGDPAFIFHRFAVLTRNFATWVNFEQVRAHELVEVENFEVVLQTKFLENYHGLDKTGLT